MKLPAFAVQLTGPQFEQAVRLLMKAAKGDDKALASTGRVTTSIGSSACQIVTQRTGPSCQGGSGARVHPSHLVLLASPPRKINALG